MYNCQTIHMIKLINKNLDIICYAKYENNGKYEKIILNKIEELFNNISFSDKSAIFFNNLLTIDDYVDSKKKTNIGYYLSKVSLDKELAHDKFDYSNLSKLEFIKIQNIKKNVLIKYSSYCYY